MSLPEAKLWSLLPITIKWEKAEGIPSDPLSFNYLITRDYDKRMEKDPVLLAKVENSIKISDIDFADYDIIILVGRVCHRPHGLLKAVDENGNPLVEGRRVDAVKDKQVDELGINITPQHPETELRKAGANFESSTAFRDFFASHTVVDGRIVSGQNQNDGPEVAHLMMKVAGGAEL